MITNGLQINIVNNLYRAWILLKFAFFDKKCIIIMKFKSLWKEIIASHNSKIEGQQLRSWDKRQGRVV